MSVALWKNRKQEIARCNFLCKMCYSSTEPSILPLPKKTCLLHQTQKKKFFLVSVSERCYEFFQMIKKKIGITGKNFVSKRLSKKTDPFLKIQINFSTVYVNHDMWLKFVQQFNFNIFKINEHAQTIGTVLCFSILCLSSLLSTYDLSW